MLVPFGSPGSNRGFGVFGSVTVAPEPRVEQLPVFYTAGVSARGLFDARPWDAIAFGIATGYFSNELQRAQRDGMLLGPEGGIQDHETAMELTYRFDLRTSALLIQPDFQYIISRRHGPQKRASVWRPDRRKLLRWNRRAGYRRWWADGLANNRVNLTMWSELAYLKRTGTRACHRDCPAAHGHIREGWLFAARLRLAGR